MVDVDVLLTPREPGGHEKALLHWLGDAERHDGLVPRLLLPSALLPLALQHGLEQRIDRSRPVDSLREVMRALASAPRRRPLLLAPGVLHAQAWLLAAAVLSRRPVWVYVPMTFSAKTMGYRWAAPRDRALVPWLARVRAFVTIDAQQADRLRQEWAVSAPVYTLPNRVSVRGGAPAQPAPDSDGRLRVGYVGRFDLHQKGLDWLADALCHDDALADGFRWRFQGSGPGELALQTLASRLGPQRVEVAPFAPLEEALAQVDLLLLPSRYEGLPLVALEATARGWPMVASDRAGLSDLLPPCSIFPFGAPAAMAAALHSLAQPSARRAAVAHARRRLLERLPGAAYHQSRRALVEALRQAEPPEART